MGRIAAALLCLALVLAISNAGHAAEPDQEATFSGPQPGEAITSFQVKGVYDDQQDKELDFVASAKGKPLVLIFVHDVTRPAVGLVRVLSKYAHQVEASELHAGIVWLTDDAAEASRYLVRARKSLNFEIPVGVFAGGLEGPGSYGLNREVALTILVCQDEKVAANFALIDPSLTDAEQILAAIAKPLGKEPPKLAELLPEQSRNRGETKGEEVHPSLRALLRGVIRKDATTEQVKEAVAALEEFLKNNPDASKQLGQIARRVVSSEKFEEYGTPAARAQLKEWANRLGDAQQEKPASDRPKSDKPESDKPASKKPEAEKPESQPKH